MCEQEVRWKRFYDGKRKKDAKYMSQNFFRFFEHMEPFEKLGYVLKKNAYFISCVERKCVERDFIMANARRTQNT